MTDAKVLEIIEKVMKKYPKAKRIAVENFLITATPYSYEINVANAEYDRMLYRWKDSTYYAILYGLKLMKDAGLLNRRD